MTRTLSLGIVGKALLALGFFATAFPLTAAPAPEPMTMGPLPGASMIHVAGLSGSPKAVDQEGNVIELEIGTRLRYRTKIETDADSRISLKMRGGHKPSDFDLLALGPDTKVEIVNVRPNSITPDGPEPFVQIVVERGTFRGVVGHHAGTNSFTFMTGERKALLWAADVVGTYDPEADKVDYLVSKGKIVIESGKRKIQLREGMTRTIQGKRVKGAQRFIVRDWEKALEKTAIADIAVPVPIALADLPSEQPVPVDSQPAGGADAGAVVADKSKPGDPEAWEYNPKTNRYWNPEHGHWHVGKPPADRKTPPRAPGREASDTQVTKKSTGDKNTGDPGPWEYDAETNRYWNPEHGHWHDGKPPADKVAGASTEQTGAADADPADLEYVKLTTTMGDIILELDKGRAPLSVENFLGYVDSGFLDGTIFHRVIGNFMIQGGGFGKDMDKKSTGPGVKNEWQNGLSNKRGTVAMARLGNQPDSGTSQFFINVVDNAALDVPRDGAGYAVFGKVVVGMNVVDEIKKVKTGMVGRYRDVPLEPVIIEMAKRTDRSEVYE